MPTRNPAEAAKGRPFAFFGGRPYDCEERSMEEWLHLVTKDAVVLIDAMFIIVVVGTVEAFFIGLWAAFPVETVNRRLREVWLRYGRWLVAGLTFPLAADIVGTSIAPTWQEAGKLGAIAVIRTFLNFFLERDLAELRDRDANPIGANQIGTRGKAADLG